LKLNVSELVLLTLLYSEKQMIAGRTLLQKTLYFLNEMLNQDIDFRSYYYGPYSSEITDCLDSLKATGIVSESIEEFPSFDFNVTFEPRKYTYLLRDIGESIAKDIEKTKPEDAEKIKNVLGEMKKHGVVHDYKNLSIAAKMHHILKKENQPLAPKEILEEAKALEWYIGEGEAVDAISFLEQMKLIEGHDELA